MRAVENDTLLSDGRLNLIRRNVEREAILLVFKKKKARMNAGKEMIQDGVWKNSDAYVLREKWVIQKQANKMPNKIELKLSLTNYLIKTSPLELSSIYF